MQTYLVTIYFNDSGKPWSTSAKSVRADSVWEYASWILENLGNACVPTGIEVQPE